ncbi:MAG: hypothetical protein HC876_14775, partial [Chloroflexaceae bacterium]|nr:hypothetical protein [Chloroflexaceae bacterium]
MKERSAARRLQVGILVLIAGTLLGWWIIPHYLGAQADVHYHQETGHYITNDFGFLAYWRQHNGEQSLGAPVTGAFLENGMPVQYFQYGRLEAHTKLEGAPIMLGRVGAEYAEALWVQFAHGRTTDVQPGEQFFAETGHTLAEPFLSYWHNNGALTTLGVPHQRAALGEYRRRSDPSAVLRTWACGASPD